MESSREGTPTRPTVRLAVNCAIATRGVSGSARGLEHLLSALRSRKAASVELLWPTRGMRRSRLWNVWAQASWDLRGAAVESQCADVLISPCNVGRAGSGQGHVLVVHDTMVLDYPEAFARGYVAYARALFGLSIRAASVIVVPSRYTERRVRGRWPDAPPTVVAGFPLTGEDHVRTILAERGRILMVGATEIHKRHMLGIQAVRIARALSGEDLRLVIVGPQGRAEQQVDAQMRVADPDSGWISRLGSVPQHGLGRQYERAWLLLQPSRSEGYGLPVGEAAARGIPCVHSGNGSLNEIAPGAVEAPDDPVAYARAIVALLEPNHHAAAAHAALAAAQNRTRDAYFAVVALALTMASGSS